MHTLYIDTRDLINLFSSRDGSTSARILELVSSKRVQVGLSFAHILEIWKYADESRNLALAEYADSLCPVWIFDRSYLFQEEVRLAFFKSQGHPIKENQLIPFRNSPLEVFGKGKDIHGYGFKSFLQLLYSDNDLSKWLQMASKLHGEYPEWTNMTKENVSRDLPGKDRYLTSLTKKALKGIEDSDEEISNFAKKLTEEVCPSIFLYLSVKDAINRDKLLIPHESEMVDMVHLAALPYVDAFSTDKRIADLVRRTKLNKLSNGWRNRENVIFKSLSNALDYIEQT